MERAKKPKNNIVVEKESHMEFNQTIEDAATSDLLLIKPLDKLFEIDKAIHRLLSQFMVHNRDIIRRRIFTACLNHICKRDMQCDVANRDDVAI